MTKEELYDLAAGVALVALGYALWKHFKAGTPTTTGLPATGTAYNPANPGALTSLADLLSGVITDPLDSTATIGQINASVTGESPSGSVVSVNPW